MIGRGAAFVGVIHQGSSCPRFVLAQTLIADCKYQIADCK